MKISPELLNSSVQVASELKNEGIRVEPNEYFRHLKGKLQETEEKELYASLEYLLSTVKDAKSLGQEKLLSSVKLNSRIILNELKLNAIGINKFVYRNDLKEFIDKVTPANSVKVIELERFPRIIPQHVVQEIKRVKDLNLFDKYCVIFTDFTKQTYSTPEEKKVINRNRDPIIFGYFEDSKTNEKGERFYFIADWEDEYCDLTIEKLANKMAKDKIGEGVVTIKDVKSIVKDATKLVSSKRDSTGFFSRLKSFFNGK